MKKSWVIIIATILIFSLVSCSNGDNVKLNPATLSNSAETADTSLTISILTFSGTGLSNSFLSEFVSYANYLYSDIDIEIIDICVEDQAEYNTMISQLKAEIMAGGGPDIYLLPTDSYTLINSEDGETLHYDSFFGDVAEAMENRLFLPIDGYIAASEHIRMNNYPQMIMDAGKSEEGQVVMPLAYTYDLLLLDKTQMQNPQLTYNSLDELLNCGDNNLLSTIGSSYKTSWFRSLFGHIADYKNSKLLISEDDILSTVEKVDFDKTNSDIKLSVYNEPTITGIVDNCLSYSVLETWYQNQDIVYPAHIPNTEKGITAYIPLFTAINANTEHPDKAFQIMELLFSDVVQQHSSYGNYGSTIHNSYINNFIMGETAVSIDIYACTRQEYKDYLATLNSKINVVRYESDLEDLLNSASVRSNESISEHIHHIYTEMQMEMAE